LWLGPRIARFRARRPEIELRLDLTDSDPDTFWRNVDVMIYLPRDYHLVYAEAVADLPEVAAFRDWLVEETRALRPPA
jgi:DNA-binding transcriptional LysR family regulator